MFQPITRKIHAFLDYGYAGAIFAAPELFNFKDEPKAVLAARVLGSQTGAVSLLTRYELGLVRVLPFKIHLLGDVLVGLSALSAPFLLGFSQNKRARNAFLGFGALTFVVVALSQPREMD